MDFSQIETTVIYNYLTNNTKLYSELIDYNKINEVIATVKKIKSGAIKETSIRVVIAKGVPLTEGQDGWIKYYHPHNQRVVIGVDGKADFRIISSEAKTGAAEVNGAKVAFESPALQRKTIDGAVIPDVARPLLEKGSSLTTSEALAATKAEAERLAALNPALKGVSDLAGAKVTVLDRDHLIKLAGSDLQFKFTPQLGQFLKAGGKITEEHIGEAFAVQKGGSKKLLGEILVDLKHATTADVEKAFADQNTVKAALKAAREDFLKKF
jgi:hypothetical protein